MKMHNVILARTYSITGEGMHSAIELLALG